jgi:hypothetical protein
LWSAGKLRIAEIGVAALLAWVAYAQSRSVTAFRFISGEEFFPKGAAEFVLSHHITGRMLNDYHLGGYLIWKMWPQAQVFQDGRALNESVFADANRMQWLESSGGKDPSRLMDEYGIDVILMSGFEFRSGRPYPLIPALALLPDTQWKLVYQDFMSVVLMRHPPADVKPLNPRDTLVSMETQCLFHMRYYPGQNGCAMGMSKLLEVSGDQAGARKWAAFAGAQ